MFIVSRCNYHDDDAGVATRHNAMYYVLTYIVLGNYWQWQCVTSICFDHVLVNIGLYWHYSVYELCSKFSLLISIHLSMLP